MPSLFYCGLRKHLPEKSLIRLLPLLHVVAFAQAACYHFRHLFQRVVSVGTTALAIGLSNLPPRDAGRSDALAAGWGLSVVMGI